MQQLPGQLDICLRAASLVAILLALPIRDAAAGARSDGIALEWIFGVDAIAENQAGILRATTHLSREEQFRTLADFVLPSSTHASIRFSAAFRPAQHRRETVRPVDRLQSVVFDLIETAKQFEELDALRDTVAALTFEDEIEQRQRIALLALIEIARSNFEAAMPLLDEMEARRRTTTFPNLAERWPETLLLSEAVEHPPLRDAVEPMLQRIVGNQVRAGHHSGPAFWDVHMQSVLGRLKYLRHVEMVVRNESPVSPADLPRFGDSPHLTQWTPIAEGDEATFARGFPNSHWHQFDDRVEKLSGHRDEYLYFCSPLRGDFQVECDITGFGHREGQLAVGGNWIWLHFNRQEFFTGGLRGKTGSVPIKPRLSEVNDWLRYRSVVRNGVVREFVNGRLLRSQKLRETQFPWIAIRSPYWASTSVRDVRITGSPTIPHRIPLASDPELSGWVRFHLDLVGGPTADWRFDESLGPNGGIVARLKDEYDGMFQESLLRYHRPLLEDGVIEYEFDYQPGQTNVAPALGRNAFLIEPGGIRRHLITNGVWDTTGLDPLNQSAIPNDLQSDASIPLQIGWNQLRLTVVGNDVAIELNETPVLRMNLDVVSNADGDQNLNRVAGSDRQFGLFHFADQTNVRVRNMFWSGNWPKTLPPLSEQELKDSTVDRIHEQLAHLKDRVELDFEAQAIRTELKSSPFQNFRIPYRSAFNIWPSSDGRGKSIERPNGLLMTRAATNPFSDTQIAIRFRTIGNFDFVAEFSDLKLRTPTDGNSAIYLIVVADDTLGTHRRVWHGVYAHPGIDRRRVTQTETNRYRKTGVEIHYDGLASEACDSGRLRVARIGSTMHFMISEQDSSAFRLLHSTDAEDEPLKVDGIRLASGTYDNHNPPSGGVQVTWKQLTMRAENLIPFTTPRFRTVEN